ncbi:unnamed protein product [Caenorhabditis angaria]|uniref:Metal transporter n=1 Tax=Caenorhabditis angaria TaxID=860376 RepID=A0A9P1I520_9PELO|nr:unnamed protein product [Caenorhabditis angaria]
MGILQILIITIITSLAANRIRLSGLRNSNYRVFEVLRNTEFNIEVFGTNLPGNGYFFTTTSRCEDYDRKDLGEQSTVVIKNEMVKTFGRFAYLKIEKGLPFTVENPVYHLCNTNSNSTYHENLEIRHELSTTQSFWSSSMICVYCVLMSAFSSGMTIGFMRFSITDLQRMLDYEEPVKTRARRILKFRSRSNWLVCTFSLCSTFHSVLFTASVERMLESHEHAQILSIIVPTLILFIFAEFLPQAVCNSKFGFVLAFWTLANYTSKIIDMFLGRDVREVMTEEEKLNIIRNMAKNSNSKERKILERATQFSSKTVKDVMTPIEKVFLIPASQKLTKTTLLTLVEKGFTRVPIRDDKNSDNIFAVLNVKELINFDLKSAPAVSKIIAKTDRTRAQMKYVISEMKVQELMQQMRTGGFHIATVIKFTQSTYQVIGIITIEDILEQIFGDLEDETKTISREPKFNNYTNSLVINWCREAGSDPKYPLSFCQQLLIIQCVLSECPVFQKFGIDVLQAKQLLRSTQIRKAAKNEVISIKPDIFLVIWKGTLEIDRGVDEIHQEVSVDQKDGSVPCFIAGKNSLKHIFQMLKLSGNEEMFEKETIKEITVMSEECMYFKIRSQEIIDVVNETESNLSKSDKMQNLASCQSRKSNTPTLGESKELLEKDPKSYSRTPSPSISRVNSTEETSKSPLRSLDSDTILELCKKNK